ncbi:MAG TPA: DNA-directed DNA polymerase [Candidatus Nanoarchaeia archaeon]|nr:DNA-directed DNA polymerase [Candidatus Nanoarchaeia archaeon]
MKIDFYPYDFDYKIVGGKVYLCLYSKLENAPKFEVPNTSPTKTVIDKICLIQEYRPYFYAGIDGINTEELAQSITALNSKPNLNAAITSWEKVEKDLVGYKGSFWKIYVDIPKSVPIIASELERWGVKCYERDILFVHRYMRDKGILPLALASAEGEFITELIPGMKIPLFLAKEIISGDSTAETNWKILALDIETYAKKKEIDPEKNPILMVALHGYYYGEKYEKVITWKNIPSQLGCVEIVEDEVAMIRRVKEIIKDYNPDILTGYFSDGFDLPYLKLRADKFKLKLDFGLDGSELDLGSKSFHFSSREGETRIRGILHLDVFKFIRRIFGMNLKTDSYKLDSVAEELLGQRKQEVNLDELAPAWDNFDEAKLAKFIEYNLHDAYLTAELCRRLLSDMIEFSRIIGLPAFDVIRMSFSRLVESYILKRAIEFNVLAPNKPSNTEIASRVDDHIQGGFVYEPIPNLYSDIVVFDFRSLYPTIITAHNISPESFHKEDGRDKIFVPGKEQFWFSSKPAFLPTILGDIITKRSKLKEEIKLAKQNKNNDLKFLEARSYALKILANSFYGYLGFYAARWYCIEGAASTTALARDYIQKTIKKAEQDGFKVIYADTDSCFLLLDGKSLDRALQFRDEVNDDLPGQMELELEGYFTHGIFVATKGSIRGAKKKYALISPEGKLKITGFETVRKNWSPLAKEVQQAVLRLALKNKSAEAVKYVREMVKELKDGKVHLDKLILKTQITRELESYNNLAPHVYVAQKMVQKGEKVGPGTIVRYVIVKGRGLVRDRAKLPEEVQEGGYDSNYYITHQLLPAVNSILAVFGYSDEDLISSSSQKGLGAFFE